MKGTRRIIVNQIVRQRYHSVVVVIIVIFVIVTLTTFINDHTKEGNLIGFGKVDNNDFNSIVGSHRRGYHLVQAWTPNQQQQPQHVFHLHHSLSDSRKKNLKLIGQSSSSSTTTTTLTETPRGVLLWSSRTADISESSLTTTSNNMTATTSIPTAIGSSSSSSTSTSNGWFPKRIQEIMNYNEVIQRLYVRHIVTQTKEMAELVVQYYILNNYQSSSATQSPLTTTTTEMVPPKSMDPFADVAKLMSNCLYTKNEGGKIGWIDRILPNQDDQQQRNNNTTTTTTSDESSSSPYSTMISNVVIQELYELQPKPGDVHIIEDYERNQYHVVQVTEVWMDPQMVVEIASSSSQQQQQKSRKKQKSILLNMKENQATFRTYDIQTAGCQMNVADSERIEGILQNELQMERIRTQKDLDDDDDERITKELLQLGVIVVPPTTSDTITTTTTEEPKKSKKKKKKTKPILPDLLIINTCSIRDHAEQKLYHMVGPYAQRKRKAGQQPKNNNNNNNNITAVIVTGCVAQQEGEKLIQRLPEIDAVVGPQYIPYLRTIVEHIQNGGNQLVLTAPLLIQQEQSIVQIQQQQVQEPKRSDETTITTSSTPMVLLQNDETLYTRPLRGHDVRAWVNVIHGCNEHCTYCVVPSTRGMEQSRTMEHILQECMELSSLGYKEITLLGQNIDAYGRDMVPKRTFAQLLQYLNEQLTISNGSSIERIRYVTSHPRYFSDRVIDAVTHLDKVCECFHMPFQSGDDTVLKRMRRGYTQDSYFRIIQRIKDTATDDAAITTDIIVGFPNETDEQFQNTLRIMEAVKFDNVNSFIYSPRPNTEAAFYEDTIPYHVKQERLQQVQQLAMQHGQERSNRYLNRIVEVLVEDCNPKNPLQQVMGRTRQGRQVYFDGILSKLKGKLVTVRVTEARTWSLMGELALDEVVVK